MAERKKIIKVIFDVIDELNRQLAKEQRLKKSPETVLIGENGNLDSLGLVNFIVALEEKIEDQFKTTIILFDDPLVLSENSPLRTIGTLADYISKKLEKS